MSHLVSEYSQIGGSMKTQPHAGVKMTVVDAKDSFEDIIQPVALPTGGTGLLQAGQVITFISAATSQYTDLSKSYVRIRGTWTNQAAGAITYVDTCSPAVGFPNCLFDDVGLYLNGSTISPNRTGDPWIAFVDRLLLNRIGQFGNSNAQSTVFATVAATTTSFNFANTEIEEGYSLDTLDTVDAGIVSPPNLATFVPPNGTSTNVTNYGAIKRANTIYSQGAGGNLPATATQFEYIYQPNVGVWNMKKYLPDRIEVKLLLRIASPLLYCNAITTKWMFNITNMELIMHRVELQPEILQQNAVAIVDRPWLCSTYQWIYNRLNVNSQNIDLTSVYQGPRPKFCLVAFSDAGTVSSTGNYNMYFMSEGSPAINNTTAPAVKTNYIQQIFLLVNGKQYPIRKPYDPSGINGHVRDYRALLSSTADSFPTVAGSLINYRQYCSNYTWYCFQLSALEGENEDYDMTSQCQIEIHGNFANALPAAPNTASNQICHFIAYVDATLEINANRSCMLKY